MLYKYIHTQKQVDGNTGGGNDGNVKNNEVCLFLFLVFILHSD